MDEVEKMAVGLAVAKRTEPGFDVEAALWALRGTVSDDDLVWAAAHGLGLRADCLIEHVQAEPDRDRVELARAALRRAGFHL